MSNRSDLLAYRCMLRAIRGDVAAVKGNGKLLEEATAAKFTAAFSANWSQLVINPDFFSKIYEVI